MSDGLAEGRVGAAIGAKPAGRGWQLFLATAALFNFVIGIDGMFVPDATVDGRVIGVLVFCFGIIYMFAARDPARLGPALWAGVIGKFGVVGLLGPDAISSASDPVLIGVLAIDVFYALGFLAFLLSRREEG